MMVALQLQGRIPCQREVGVFTICDTIAFCFYSITHASLLLFDSFFTVTPVTTSSDSVVSHQTHTLTLPTVT